MQSIPVIIAEFLAAITPVLSVTWSFKIKKHNYSKPLEGENLK